MNWIYNVKQRGKTSVINAQKHYECILLLLIFLCCHLSLSQPGAVNKKTTLIPAKRVILAL